MKRYLKILLIRFKISLMGAFEYKYDFFLRILRSLLEVGVMIILISSFYANSFSIAGWSRYETLLVYGIFKLVGSFVFMFAGYGIEGLYRDIIFGRIDRYLLLPIDSQFTASTKVSYVTNFFRLILNGGIVVYAILNLEINPLFIDIGLSILSILSSIVIYYSIFFAVSIISFWTFSGELWFLMDSISSSMKYPIDYFSKIVRLIFSIIPLVYVSSVPVKALFGENLIMAAASPLVAAISFFITRKLWDKGLKNYESVSS